MSVFDAPAEFALSTRVRVATAGDESRTTFDAAALCLWADENHWAKLCFEYSPQGQAMVVSVVTNEYSDDCNSVPIDERSVFLRVSRIGAAWAFHSSSDGVWWDFVRLFRLQTVLPIGVGFLSQTPLGDSCVSTFEPITLAPTPPSDLRDGS